MTTDDQAVKLTWKCGLLNAIVLFLSFLNSACGGGGSGADTPTGEQGGPTGSSCQMTSNEQEMLSQVNSARSQARNCGSTPYPAVATLSWDCKLAQAAANHSNDMAQNNFFSHIGSDGLGPSFRIQAQDYQAQTWGENIAIGYTATDAAMTAWLNSAGHCRNLMDPDFTELGMAFAENQGSDYGIYWTQVFAAPASASSQTSVEYNIHLRGQLGSNGLYSYPVID